MRGFANAAKRAKVIRAYVESPIEPTLDSAFLYEKTFFMKDRPESPKGINPVLRQVQSDFDGVWTSLDTPFSMELYFKKCAERPEFRYEMTNIKQILKDVKNNPHPDDLMEEYQRILRRIDFRESHHKEAVDYAVEHTNLVVGAQEFLRDLHNMGCELKINSGSLKDIITNIVQQRFSIKVPDENIKASVKHFKPDGSFDYMDWNLGYKKEPDINGFSIAISDERESDFSLSGFTKLNYTQTMNPAYWIEEKPPITSESSFVENWVPKAREDISILTNSIKKYDIGFLITAHINEEEFEYLISVGNAVKSICDSIETSDSGDLETKSYLTNVVKVYLDHHGDFFPIQNSGIMKHLAEFESCPYRSDLMNLGYDLINILELYSLPIRLPRNFLNI